MLQSCLCTFVHSFLMCGPAARANPPPLEAHIPDFRQRTDVGARLPKDGGARALASRPRNRQCDVPRKRRSTDSYVLWGPGHRPHEPMAQYPCGCRPLLHCHGDAGTTSGLDRSSPASSAALPHSLGSVPQGPIGLDRSLSQPLEGAASLRFPCRVHALMLCPVRVPGLLLCLFLVPSFGDDALSSASPMADAQPSEGFCFAVPPFPRWFGDPHSGAFLVRRAAAGLATAVGRCFIDTLCPGPR